MASGAYLTAEEAAAYLGVSRPTLYAYVSRGFVLSEPASGAGGRTHRYPRAALEELKARRARDASSGQAPSAWGRPVLDSALTLMGDGRLYYRGRDARELSRSATFEQVARLLWTGSLDGAAELFPRSASPGRPRGGRSFVDLLVACLAERRAGSAVTLSEPSPAALRAAGRTVRRLFDAVGAAGWGTLSARLARGWGTTRAEDLNAALVLCADHELNTSAFTARCVASTDAPMHNVLLAALCALEGRRHGGAAGHQVAELVASAERIGATHACRRALSSEGRLAGFEHGTNPLYPDGDPRADELLSRLTLRGADPVAQTIAFAHRELGARPGLDLALVALERSARLPAGAAFAVFALGRSVGWVAHALETAAEGTLIRPRARYVGALPDTH